jgi:hypothetical protein
MCVCCKKFDSHCHLNWTLLSMHNYRANCSFPTREANSVSHSNRSISYSSWLESFHIRKNEWGNRMKMLNLELETLFPLLSFTSLSIGTWLLTQKTCLSQFAFLSDVRFLPAKNARVANASRSKIQEDLKAKWLIYANLYAQNWNDRLV